MAENIAPLTVDPENVNPLANKQREKVSSSVNNQVDRNQNDGTIRPTTGASRRPFAEINHSQPDRAPPANIPTTVQDFNISLQDDTDNMDVDIVALQGGAAFCELSEMECLFRDVEYSQDNLFHWKKNECNFKPNPKYMKRQRDIDWDMRGTLVDWLVEVCEEYKLHNETLYLAVYFIDRYLSKMSCAREKLQLVGITALFIASKYEEIYPPSAGEFISLTDNTYTISQMLKLEVNVIKTLGFKLTNPTSNSFLLDFLQRVDETLERTTPDELLKLQYLSQYLLELTLLTGDTFLNFLPSQIAASVLYVAADTLYMQKWTVAVCNKSGYELDELSECIRYLFKLHRLAPTMQWHAIRDKYETENYDFVTSIPALRQINLPSRCEN